VECAGSVECRLWRPDGSGPEEYQRMPCRRGVGHLAESMPVTKASRKRAVEGPFERVIMSDTGALTIAGTWSQDKKRPIRIMLNKDQCSDLARSLLNRLNSAPIDMSTPHAPDSIPRRFRVIKD
jgi:hypothetical protein